MFNFSCRREQVVFMFIFIVKNKSITKKAESKTEIFVQNKKYCCPKLRQDS